MKKTKNNYYDKIVDLTTKLPKHLCVAFAIYCAKDQLHKITDKDQYSKCLKSLDITEKYMKGLASKSELESAAAYAAYNAAYNAANASYPAATAAAYAAAYNAARVDKEIKLKEYYEVLLGIINNLSKLEKLIFNINKELK